MPSLQELKTSNTASDTQNLVNTSRFLLGLITMAPRRSRLAIDLVRGTFNSLGLWFVCRLWSDVVLVAWINFFVSLCALDQRNEDPLYRISTRMVRSPVAAGLSSIIAQS